MSFKHQCVFSDASHILSTRLSLYVPQEDSKVSEAGKWDLFAFLPTGLQEPFINLAFHDLENQANLFFNLI